VDNLHDVHRSLIVEGDPTQTLMRVHVLRGNFFDFEPFALKHLQDNVAKLEISFHMNALAEEGACYQTAGYLERLLELAGAENVQTWFTQMAWDGDPVTMLEMMWEEAPTGRRVKGTLFLDYVRMVKSRKDVDWTKYLTPADLELLETRIDDSEWYPFDAFERLGIGIVTETAGGDMEKVRMWGFFSIDELLKTHPDLVAPDDPPESLMRFQVLRRSFFDFDPVRILDLRGGSVKIEINYEMSALAEEAATHQTLGFFERLLLLSGATLVEHGFETKKWEGHGSTILELRWTEPDLRPAPRG
jgi:hypothetical protein